MRDIIESNYEVYRKWFEESIDLIWRIPAEMRAGADPISELAKTESVSRTAATKALLAGILDTVSVTDRFTQADIAEADKILNEKNLPTLTSMRTLFSKNVRKILRQGSIENDDEYYALKSLEDASIPSNIKDQVVKFIADYESRAS